MHDNAKKTLFAETFQKISFLCIAAYVGSMILEKYDFSLSSPVSCYAISLSLFAFSFCQLFIIAVVLAFVLCSQEPKIWYPDPYYHGGEH